MNSGNMSHDELTEANTNLKSIPQMHTFNMMAPMMKSVPWRPKRCSRAVIKGVMANMPRPLPLKAMPLARVRLFSKYCPTTTVAGVKLRAAPSPETRLYLSQMMVNLSRRNDTL